MVWLWKYLFQSKSTRNRKPSHLLTTICDAKNSIFFVEMGKISNNIKINMTCHCIKLDTIFVSKKFYKTALDKFLFSFFFVYVCFYVFPSVPHSASQFWVLFCCDGFVFLSGSLSCWRWMVSHQPPWSLSLSNPRTRSQPLIKGAASFTADRPLTGRSCVTDTG